MNDSPIGRFEGPWRFLSNFWPSPVEYSHATFPTAEHAYQAQKDPSRAHQEAILACATPGQAKRVGARAWLRPSWDELRVHVMRDVLNRKFADRGLALKLLGTGIRDLVEGNDWGDTFWGVCRGRGENTLGKLLMDLRREMRGIGGKALYPTYLPRGEV